jgi:hypothetical protein
VLSSVQHNGFSVVSGNEKGPGEEGKDRGRGWSRYGSTYLDIRTLGPADEILQLVLHATRNVRLDRDEEVLLRLFIL